MANDNSYVPSPADVSSVKETALVKAFAESLGELFFEDSIRHIGGRPAFSAPDWKELSSVDRGFFYDKALFWAKYLEQRFGLDAILGGDDIRPDYLEEDVARQVHEKKASRLVAEGWVLGPTTDSEKKTSPTLVYYDDLPFGEVLECRRIGGIVNAGLNNFVEEYQKGIDTVDELIDSKGKRFNIGYGMAVEALSDVRSRLESGIGWKSSSRHYNFTGVSGFYPKFSRGSVSIMHGDKTGLRFYPKADGSVGMDVLSDAFSAYRDMSPLNVICDLRDGRYCLDGANLDLLRKETHQGHEVIYGLRYGESAAFCIPQGDDSKEDLALMRGLTEREKNIRIVDASVFSQAIEKWMEQTIGGGFEPAQTPKIMHYLFDGEHVYSEREKSLDMVRTVSPEVASDWKLIDALLEGGESLRYEFQSTCGIDSGRKFKFADALYPSPLVSEEALFLCSKNGAQQHGFLTAVKGEVCMYKSMDGFLQGSEKPMKVFPSVKDGLDYFRSIVMRKENIMQGRSEVSRYNKQKGIGINK